MAGEAGGAALMAVNPWLGLASSVLGAVAGGDAGPNVSQAGAPFGTGTNSTGSFSVGFGSGAVSARSDASMKDSGVSGESGGMVSQSANNPMTTYLAIGAIAISMIALSVMAFKK